MAMRLLQNVYEMLDSQILSTWKPEGCTIFSYRSNCHTVVVVDADDVACGA
jgi:hypothetical protein